MPDHIRRSFNESSHLVINLEYYSLELSILLKYIFSALTMAFLAAHVQTIASTSTNIAITSIFDLHVRRVLTTMINVRLELQLLFVHTFLRPHKFLFQIIDFCLLVRNEVSEQRDFLLLVIISQWRHNCRIFNRVLTKRLLVNTGYAVLLRRHRVLLWLLEW